MKLTFFVLVLFAITTSNAIYKRTQPISVTTSVIIPCHRKHFAMLRELLIEYEQQTVIPNEIVVVISATHSMSNKAHAELENLKKTKWPYVLKVITARADLSAGNSRNLACDAAVGDIFICQDADDIPHPQRVQIIKWFFETHDIEHLMHGFIESHDKSLFKPIDRDAIHSECLAQYKLIHYIANGPVAISRNLFEKVRWSDEFIHSEDVLFNEHCYEATSKTVVIYSDLYLYRRGIKMDPI